MKSAILHIAVVEFTCPYCGEHVSAPHGSHMFGVSEIPDTLKCESCGKALAVPARAKKIREGR
jgi:predicted RNA-binding Zn-ribbon protein involved in translation (DUF1610 family)